MELSPQELKQKQTPTNKKTSKPIEQTMNTTQPQIPSSEYTHFKMIPASQGVWGPPSTTILKDPTCFSEGSLEIVTSPDSSEGLEVSEPAGSSGQNRLIKSPYFVIFL